MADEQGDMATARVWWTRAAAHDHPAAMYNLGLLAHEDGDRAPALTWLWRAADLGDPGAREALRTLG